MHIKLWLETSTKREQLQFQMDQNRVQLGGFVTRAGNPQRGQFLEHPNEDITHIVSEGCLWNQQL
jgi:hypothetical protein